MTIRRNPLNQRRANRLTSRSVQDREAVPLGVIGNLHDLLLQLLELKIQITALIIAIRIVDRFDRQFAHALQRVGHLLGRALGGLHQRNRVAGVTHRLPQRLDLLGHPR